MLDVVCGKCGFPIRDGFCGLSCDGRADGVAVVVAAESRAVIPEPPSFGVRTSVRGRLDEIERMAKCALMANRHRRASETSGLVVAVLEQAKHAKREISPDTDTAEEKS